MTGDKSKPVVIIVALMLLLSLVGLAGSQVAAGAGFPVPVSLTTAPTRKPTSTIMPTRTPTPGPGASSGKVSSQCTNDVAFVSDVTVPDNTPFEPGTQFVKTWQVQNTGTCLWGAGYRLAFVAGEQMGAPAVRPVDFAAAGGLAEISVPMIAPSIPGTYSGVWQMGDAQGNPFGHKLTVVIQVPGTPATAGDTVALPAAVNTERCGHEGISAPMDWPLLFCDTFDSNQNNWPTDDWGTGEEYSKSWVADGVYHWELKTQQTVAPEAWPDAAALENVSDFYLSVDAQRLSGDANFYGLTFRRADDRTMYVFFIRDDQTFLAVTVIDGRWNTWIDLTPSDAIRPDEINRLAVKSVGLNYTFFINDQQVTEAQENQLGFGGPGLIIGLDADEDNVFQFDNFEVRTTPPDRTASQLPHTETAPTPTQELAQPAGSCCKPLESGKGAIWIEHFVGTNGRVDIGPHFFELPSQQNDVPGCACPQLEPGHYTVIHNTDTHGGNWEIDVAAGQTVHFPISYAG